MVKTIARQMEGRIYYLSPYVRYVDISGRITILDIRSESYFALEPLASLMWKGLAEGHTQAQCLNDIIRQTASDDPGLAEDLASFTGQCVDKGILTVSPDSLPAVKTGKHAVRDRQRFATVRAWLWLARTTRSLSLRGFCGTYITALNIPAIPDLVDPGPLLNQAVRAFSRAENLFHLKKAPLDCLPRSLALFFFLRGSGLPAEHCIGIRQFPFAAHAWTELGGRVVHDDPSNQETFSVISRIRQ